MAKSKGEPRYQVPRELANSLAFRSLDSTDICKAVVTYPSSFYLAYYYPYLWRLYNALFTCKVAIW
jgi:hypothetical protein